MSSTSYDNLIARGATSNGSLTWYNEVQASTATLLSGNQFNLQRVGYQTGIQTFGGTTTKAIPTMVTGTSSSANTCAVFGKLVNLGSLACSTNTFTDGSAMPTATVLGNASTSLVSCVIVEVTTTLSGTPGNLTLTYVDQDGNVAEAGPVTPLTASSARDSAGLYALNSTDWGVRDITAATVSATGAGVLQFWGMIPLGMIILSPNTVLPSTFNPITSGFNLQRWSAGDTVGYFAFGVTAIKTCAGMMSFIGDN